MSRERMTITAYPGTGHALVEEGLLTILLFLICIWIMVK